MRIAQVAPLYESVPPRLYGGTERVVSYLTEELVSQGHEVTLFASGDSVTKASLVSPCRKALRLDEGAVDHLAHHILMLEHVFKRRAEFDIIHFHIDYLHYPWSRRQKVADVTTLHGRLDIPDLIPLYREFNDRPVVSISNAQRDPLPEANWKATVYHGLPEDEFTFQEKPGGYLAFLGRVSPEKRPDQAIEIAKRAGVRIKIAAKIDPSDREYHEEKVEPLLDDALVDFVGEIGGPEKEKFLQNALALLVPIDWPEPFGLVMIEAMACGTPVIAFRRGSVPEIMEDGVTGFVVDGVEQAVKAVGEIRSLDRKKCRQVFERRFTARRMAEDYVDVYQELLDESSASSISSGGYSSSQRRQESIDHPVPSPLLRLAK